MTPQEGLAPAVILVAEDEITTRELTRVTLEQAGYKVIEAEDGAAALDAFERERPDLVLLDIEMPRVDGIEVCRRLRQRPDGRHVPIVIASGVDDIASIDTAYDAGATDFIPKPFNWALLRYHVRYMLRAARAARERATRPA